MKYARNVFNFAIVNDAKAFGLLKKYRAEVNAAKNAGNGARLANDLSGNANASGIAANDNGKLIELEKKLIENHLEKMRQADGKKIFSSEKYSCFFMQLFL
jgi:hypothetical protein